MGINKVINYPVTPLYIGQQVMEKSLSVTIASDQPAIPVSGSFSFSDPSVGPINGTLPTDAALIGGNDSGTLRAIDVTRLTSVNYLKVDASAFTQPISAASLPLPTGAATSTNQTNGTQKTQIVNSSGTVTTSTAIGSKQSLDISVTSDPSLDVFATNVTGSRYNQIEINFETAPGASLITNTTSGGASITQANGHSLYSTGTATSAEAKSVSVSTVKYRPAHEIYGYFTASFTNPTSANSYQRIGIYDTNNGFFIGFNGLNFGITSRTATVDTFVNRSAFNGDLLNGSAGSNFTRNGIPEAINLVYSNVFRIRFGWLGSASILFDVFSPDGIWVTFHSIKQPNSALNPSVTNPDLPMTIDVYKSGSDATNLVMSTACWAGGTTSSYSKITDTLTDNTLASITRSVITGVTTGGGGGYVNVKVNPSGALVADVTGTVSATQSGTWNINNISGTISIPTGASTSALQTQISNQLPASLGSKTSTASLSVVLASDQVAIKSVATNSKGEFVRNDYTSTSVTTSAYTQLVASTAAAYSAVEIFDSSGQTLKLAIGAAASEIDQFIIFPGGNGRIPFTIASGSRISIKALSGTASVGEIDINFYV